MGKKSARAGDAPHLGGCHPLWEGEMQPVLQEENLFSQETSAVKAELRFQLVEKTPIHPPQLEDVSPWHLHQPQYHSLSALG